LGSGATFVLMKVIVSSMSWMRSFERFTAPAYSGLSADLSMNDWKIVFALLSAAMVAASPPPDFALYSCVRMPSL
jgi:hypothetical protein